VLPLDRFSGTLLEAVCEPELRGVR
jgi:hypothetical protein